MVGIVAAIIHLPIHSQIRNDLMNINVINYTPGDSFLEHKLYARGYYRASISCWQETGLSEVPCALQQPCPVAYQLPEGVKTWLHSFFFLFLLLHFPGSLHCEICRYHE